MSGSENGSLDSEGSVSGWVSGNENGALESDESVPDDPGYVLVRVPPAPQLPPIAPATSTPSTNTNFNTERGSR